MKIIGFNFTKINAEKLSERTEEIKIDSKIDIISIKKESLDFINSNEEVVELTFSHLIDYQKDFAKIEFKGNLLISLVKEESKELFEKWEKKELPQEIRFNVFNFILRKSNIKALQLSDDLSIPSHIPLPRLSKEQSEAPYNQKEEQSK